MIYYQLHSFVLGAFEFLESSGSTFAKLAVIADIDDLLRGSPIITMFIPTEDAFQTIDSATMEFLSPPQGIPALKEMLLFHILFGVITSSSIPPGHSAERTLQGGSLKISNTISGIYVDTALSYCTGRFLSEKRNYSHG